MARPRGVPNRNFPPLRLEESLRMARVIQDEASGMPVSRLTLAQLLGTTPSSSVFQQLVASSRMYGLTEGGINATEFSLTAVGEQATGSADLTTRASALKQAVLKIEPFRTFFETFESRKVPGGAAMKDFLVKSAAVPEPHAESCAAHILDDATTAGLVRTIGAAAWVDLEGVPEVHTDGAEEQEPGGPEPLPPTDDDGDLADEAPREHLLPRRPPPRRRSSSRVARGNRSTS
jgi:hypothetical protein